MMPMMRRDIEILLDSPVKSDFVVSAYADLSVQNGFEHHVERHLKNQMRAAGEAMAELPAGRDLKANLEVIREAVRAAASSQAKGLVVFSSTGRGLRQVIPVEFPVENRLVVNDEPFLLPLLQRWYGEPTFLVVLVDSDEAHLFEALHGPPERVRDLKRADVDDVIERDKPRFTYKKRFAQTRHERLHGVIDDRFFKEVVEAVRSHWNDGNFTGLILLGQPHLTGPFRAILPRELATAVAGEAPHAMTTRAEDLLDSVTPLIESFQAAREAAAMGELSQRWAQKHRVAGGPTDVLDALQQGRAERIFVGARDDLAGSRCNDCGYYLGAAVRACPYCNGATRPTHAVQDIMKLAMRHRVPVQTIARRGNEKEHPLTAYGDVAALLVAEANWAPDRATAAASEGHKAPI